MIRTYAVIALFMSRMIVAVFDLGVPEPPAGPSANTSVNLQAGDELPVTVVSGLPEDARTLRR